MTNFFTYLGVFAFAYLLVYPGLSWLDWGKKPRRAER